jgi:hypothetical protein
MSTGQSYGSSFYLEISHADSHMFSVLAVIPSQFVTRFL